ncbi:MAG: hypothetical protein KKB31_07485 [Nanoarchaeota archaeon]|nr:hypothetical protein [Nanoarchaeota archaeon]
MISEKGQAIKEIKTGMLHDLFEFNPWLKGFIQHLNDVITDADMKWAGVKLDNTNELMELQAIKRVATNTLARFEDDAYNQAKKIYEAKEISKRPTSGRGATSNVRFVPGSIATRPKSETGVAHN